MLNEAKHVKPQWKAKGYEGGSASASLAQAISRRIKGVAKVKD